MKIYNFLILRGADLGNKLQWGWIINGLDWRFAHLLDFQYLFSSWLCNYSAHLPLVGWQGYINIQDYHIKKKGLERHLSLSPWYLLGIYSIISPQRQQYCNNVIIMINIITPASDWWSYIWSHWPLWSCERLWDSWDIRQHPSATGSCLRHTDIGQ